MSFQGEHFKKGAAAFLSCLIALSVVVAPLESFAAVATNGGATTGGGSTDATTAAAASAAGGAATCAVAPLLAAGAAFLLGVPTGGGSAANAVMHATDNVRDNLLSCLARAAARATLQYLTISTVNWINSGFNGSPSFVTNPNQFFRGVADLAAGNFIQGSDLAFLCSPFKLQIRLALATAYMMPYAPSCTLTQVTRNIEGFMNDFSQGGWPAFISLTTTPTNNPFGAYSVAQASMLAQIAGAQGAKTFDLQLGNGFLSTQKETNCQVVTGDSAPTGPNKQVRQLNSDSVGPDGFPTNTYEVCDLVTVTPGKTIEDSLSKTLGSGQDALISAKQWDESISAIVSALVTHVLQDGLASLNNNGNGYQSTFGATMSSLASQQGNSLVSQIGTAIAPANNIIDIWNQDIAALHNSYSLAQSLQNCWQTAANSTTTTTDQSGNVVPTVSDAQRAQALIAAQAASSSLQSFTDQITGYQTNVASTTAGIILLQNYMSQAQSTTDLNALQTISQNFSSLMFTGTIPNANTVFNAQQDQQALFQRLSTTDQKNQSDLSSCTALIHGQSAGGVGVGGGVILH